MLGSKCLKAPPVNKTRNIGSVCGYTDRRKPVEAADARYVNYRRTL